LNSQFCFLFDILCFVIQFCYKSSISIKETSYQELVDIYLRKWHHFNSLRYIQRSLGGMFAVQVRQILECEKIKFEGTITIDKGNISLTWSQIAHFTIHGCKLEEIHGKKTRKKTPRHSFTFNKWADFLKNCRNKIKGSFGYPTMYIKEQISSRLLDLNC
jgi:hypothetical protein